MMKPDNYQIQAAQARAWFLNYDQEALLRKGGLTGEGEYLCTRLFCQPYRIHRTTGDIQRFFRGAWIPAERHCEVMTLLDLVCDSDPLHRPSGRWKNMQAFGLMFHQNLLEDARDAWAEKFDREPEKLRLAGERLEGQPLPACDIGWSVEVFDGLRVGVQFWHGDEDFPPRLRYLWDENALQYLRYETMYFAIQLLRHRMEEETAACS